MRGWCSTASVITPLTPPWPKRSGGTENKKARRKRKVHVFFIIAIPEESLSCPKNLNAFFSSMEDYVLSGEKKVYLVY
jgi:hypothetical protein